MEKAKRAWKRTPASIRKPLVSVLGALIIVTGIILMPLPGPGMVIVVIGVSVLASEFSWAKNAYEHIMRIARRLLKMLKQFLKRLSKK